MKKVMIWLLPALLLMLIAAGATPWGLPSGEMVAGPAEMADGTVLAAENRQVTSRIYMLQAGTLADIYEESRLKQDLSISEIIRVAADDSSAYFVRSYEDSRKWELLKLSGDKPSVLHEGLFDEDVTITGLSAEGGVVWITTVSAERDITVYEYKPSDGVQLKLDAPSWWLNGAETAEYNGRQIRVTRVNGDHCFLDPGGAALFTEEAADTPAPDIKAEGASWFACKKTILITAFIIWLIAAGSILLTAAVCRKSPRLSVRLTAISAEGMFLALLAEEITLMVVLLQTFELQKAFRTALVAAGILILIWLVALLVFYLVSRRMTRLIPAMTRQMNAVSEGDVTPQEAEPGYDELHQMNRSLQEMCIGLSIRDYEVDSTIRSYSRFIPRRLTQLLDRASVAEVSLGDSRRVEGNIGLFSVCNRDEARRTMEEADFVNFINYSFALFHDCIYENRGYMISSALRLSLMETMFPDSPADGVQAGLDFCGRAQKLPELSLPEPKPLLILHRTSFLYGVAGKEERLFPYLSSLEIEFLSGFSQKFYEAGVRIVATEAYWEQIAESGFSGRYIGFVSNGNGEACKLYEILDAYPELTRNLRLGYDHRFQEAINLFYHDDFFLARNLFSALLRVSPEDGIARWYLFACERFFNQENGGAVDHRLFSVEDEPAFE